MNSILQMSDQEILDGVNPIIDNLMQGSTEIDYVMHSRHFTDRMKAQLSSEQFKIMCREYQTKIGFFTRRDFIRLFRREHSVAVIWRQHSSKSSDEFVAEAVFVPDGSSWLVDHAMVF
ncbi:MAG: hypothetical protein R3C60_01330 [Parvularculaceae bacterium]